MKVHVPASVMHQSFDRIVRSMRLDSDEVIINVTGWKAKKRNITAISCGSVLSRRTGRDRSEAVLRADGDICLFPIRM